MLASLCCVILTGVAGFAGVCNGASMPPSMNETSSPTITLNDPSGAYRRFGGEISSRNAQMMPGFYNLDDFVHSKFVANKIVGGTEAEKGEFGYQAALLMIRDDSVHRFCGGALISRTFVVTAAHCVEWLTDFSAVRVVVGDHELRGDEGTEQRLGVRTIVIHDKYDKWALINDIALILLEGVAEFNDYVRPVNLPRKIDSESTGNGTISGWGSTIQGGPGSSRLMKATVPIVSDDKCAKAYRPFEEIVIDKTHICAGIDKGGIDSCQGDSGGPMVCDERVLEPQDEERWFLSTGDQHERPSSASVKTGPYLCGIVSFGVGCGEPGIPGVYTQVSHYLGWIEEVVRNLTAEHDNMDVMADSSYMMVHDYPFLGMVSNQPIVLLSRKHPVACIGVLLADNLVLTAADCVAPYADDDESSFWVGFGKNISPGTKTYQRIPVSDWFSFDPMMYLDEVADDEVMERAEQRHHDSAYRNKALVLELAWSVIYTDEVYPANFARQKDFVGLRAQLVSLTHKKRDKYFFRLKMKPTVSDFEIVPLNECPEDFLMEYNLNATDAICAKRMFADQRPCHDFPPGSALICNSRHDMDMEDSRMDDDDMMDSPSSFLCGIVAHMHPEEEGDSTSSTGMMPKPMGNDSGYCMFRKIWISQLVD